MKTFRDTNLRVDREGKVYGPKGLRKLREEKYLRVDIRRNKKLEVFPVHRMVAECYIPNPLDKPFVNHLNGNKYDNRVENLEWVTHSENMKHAWDTGLWKGRKPKFNKKQIEDIFYLKNLGWKHRDIAKEMECDQKTVWNVLNDKIRAYQF